MLAVILQQTFYYFLRFLTESIFILFHSEHYNLILKIYLYYLYDL
jgi:hypothetical protein